VIYRRLGPDALFYRAITPRWSFQPDSGAGAAVAGGRFNRPGVEARYLAESTEGALLEYQQESPLLPPATVVTFRVSAQHVIDFSGGYSVEDWPPIWKEAYCNWKGLAYLDNVEPPSWVIGDLARAAHACGILYRSARNPSVQCLVLYPELSRLFTAKVFDPKGDLPSNAESWTAPVVSAVRRPSARRGKKKK
jgi:RES domain-containing protein